MAAVAPSPGISHALKVRKGIQKDAMAHKLVVGAPVQGFLEDVRLVPRLQQLASEKNCEVSQSSVFFSNLADFVEIQSRFNAGVPRRAERLILRSTRSPDKFFAQQPDITENRVVFKFEVDDLKVLKCNDLIEEVIPPFVKALFELEPLRPFADHFNEVVLVPQKNGFFLCVSAVSEEIASGMHRFGQSLPQLAGGVTLPFRGGVVTLLDVHSSKARVKGVDSLYFVRFRAALCGRNVDSFNKLVAAVVPGDQPRVTLGLPDRAPQGPTFFISLRLPSDRAVEAIQAVIDAVRDTDLVQPLEACVLGPVNLGRATVCFACGGAHHIIGCDVVPRRAGAAPVASGAAPVASAQPRRMSGPPRQRLVEACKQHLYSKQGCQYGDSCKYTHVDKAAKSQRPAGGAGVQRPQPSSQPSFAPVQPQPQPSSALSGLADLVPASAAASASAASSPPTPKRGRVEESEDGEKQEAFRRKGSDGKSRASSRSTTPHRQASAADSSAVEASSESVAAASTEPTRTIAGSSRTTDSSDRTAGAAQTGDAVVQSDGVMIEQSAGVGRDQLPAPSRLVGMGEPGSLLPGLPSNAPVAVSPSAECSGSGTSRASCISDSEQEHFDSQATEYDNEDVESDVKEVRVEPTEPRSESSPGSGALSLYE